jgi:hypothetical protein
MMRAADPGAKAIVFSQFTSMLELIHFRLEQVQLCWNEQVLAAAHLMQPTPSCLQPLAYRGLCAFALYAA